MLVFFWFAFAVVVAVAAGSRGRSWLGWFLLSLVISPLLTLILVLVLPSIKDRATPETHVRCPDCRELVLIGAKVCKHCGAKLTGDIGQKKHFLDPDFSKKT